MKKTICLFVLAAIAAVSCKKEAETTATKTNYVAPAISQKDTIIAIPATMSKAANGNPILALGIATIDVINTTSAVYTHKLWFKESDMAGWKASKNTDGIIIYSFTAAGQGTVYLTYKNTTAQKYWKYETEITGKARVTVYEADEQSNTGFYKYFDQSTGKLIWQIEWAVANNTTTLIISQYNAMAQITDQYVSTSNPDKSGSLKIYRASELSWELTWDKTGSGTWKYLTNDNIWVNGLF